MSEIFKYKFGGWKEADAKRWTNPDGSAGGIVAVSARIPDETYVPAGSIVWPDASIGNDASIGIRASIGYGASIGDGASIGNDASIGDGASIGYGASIGNDASIGIRASIGYDASIGDGASIGIRASIGYGASIGNDASIGYRASIGYDASIGYRDWHVSGGPCGSRKAMWTAVYSAEHGLRWWIGCKHGIGSDALRKMIAETHGENDHAQDYLHAISFVENHPGLKRAMEKANDDTNP